MFGKRLNSEGQDILQASLEGIAASESNIRFLDGFPYIRVVFDILHDKTRVAIISGGGSGHEPSFAGFVGDGMLTAAVCGDLYAAPSAEAVLAAIHAVTGEAGCLLLPINYSGDCLNFGLAAEQARAEGFTIAMVPVGEDCAIRQPGRAGRRGLAGSIFVIKLLGALARRGTALNELVHFAHSIGSNLGTMGVGLDTCALPGYPPMPSRLEPDEIELGLGIHGEVGTQKLRLLDQNTVVDEMLKSILEYPSSSFVPGVHISLMVNSLGGVAVMDLHAVVHRSISTLEQKGIQVDFITVGTFMTSITVSGFSISLLKMEPEYASLLTEPTQAIGWTMKNTQPFVRHKKIEIPSTNVSQETAAPTELSQIGTLCKECVDKATECLISKEQELNEIDNKVGDGDCGTTMANACRAIRQEMVHYHFNTPRIWLKQLSQSIGGSSGGTSGALLNIFFMTGSQSFPSDSETTMADWVHAFEKGIESIQRYGSARRGDRTMLDVLLPTCDVLKEAFHSNMSVNEALMRMKEMAKQEADATMTMNAQAGRTSYVPEELQKTYPDPGAKATEYWLCAISDCIIESLK